MNHFLTPTLKASLMKLDKLQQQNNGDDGEYKGEPFIAATINVDEGASHESEIRKYAHLPVFGGIRTAKDATV